jgi:hypothetical protein
MEIGKPTIVDVKEPANEGQIGGNHYKKLQIQPWDYILAPRAKNWRIQVLLP